MDGMDDHTFRRIVEGMGYAPRGYRKVRAGVKRRVGRHMAETTCRDVDEYLARLHRSPVERERFHRLMTVPVSRFFRDKVLWKNLREAVLPALVDRFGTPLRIWSAGCACGEEAYSIKILWEEARLGHPPHLVATDRMPERIQRAVRGTYPRSSIREIPDTLVAHWFDAQKGGRRFRIRAQLRGGMEWQIRDVADVHGHSFFHLVFLRNSILTYYAPSRRKSAFDIICKQVMRGGCIVIGIHETFPITEDRFVPWFPCIHRRV